jgi:CRISPR-associated protein Cas2
MTVVVTRDVAYRFRGFLASCMLEIAPGVYTSSDMNPRVRERIWEVLQQWFFDIGGGSIVMTWSDPKSSTGQGVSILGLPPINLVNYDGMVLCAQRIRDNKEFK